ncbi:MAG: diadenylate cyclase CdaA [Oscillospiraceae bacterium]|nr:diadenylate cyclase CdaA [Oscillospiraceae bacterium]
MNYLETLIQKIGTMQWSDYLDIILVAFLIYKLLPMFRASGTSRVAKVIFAILVLAWFTETAELNALNFLINQVLAVGLIAVIVLFQPELRRMLDHISNMKLDKFFGVRREQYDMDPMIAQTVYACEVMSREKVGALIVFERDSRLDDYTKTGTAIDGQVSEQLLRNIFFPKASLHDGAVIIRQGRVAAAGCVLPLSDSKRLSADLGTRHRAGVGMSELSDAVVVIVSEETGAISVAVGGMLKRHLAPQTLERLLRNELHEEDEKKEENLVLLLRQKLQKSVKEEGSDAGK